MMACVTCVTSTPSPPLLNPGYEVYCFNVSVVMAHIICVLKVRQLLAFISLGHKANYGLIYNSAPKLVFVELGPQHQPARGAFSDNLAVRLIGCQKMDLLIIMCCPSSRASSCSHVFSVSVASSASL